MKETDFPPPYHQAQLPRSLYIRGRSLRLLLVWLVVVLFLCRRWISQPAAHTSALLQDAETQCEAARKRVDSPRPPRRSNPRWLSGKGQVGVTVLRNATLFDGERVLPDPMDIVFEKGLIMSVTKTSHSIHIPDAAEYDLQGRWTSPGLVDMHSHHLAIAWPTNEMTDDANEMDSKAQGIVAMNRVLDSLKPYDMATSLICSGGVTSSLLLPGSANLVGGEGVPVKNAVASGEHGEPVVEDFLLERGVPWGERRRYMKMAMGENPKATLGYSRQGNAMHLRKHLQRAKELKGRQDEYCSALERSSAWSGTGRSRFVVEHGAFPFDIELESTVGVLRGQVAVHNHNYEPEDMETMLRIGDEFGFHIAAFHHALSAWQIPEMLKERGSNLTIATFAEFSLYKQESSSPSLYNAHILNKHGIPVAFKSDHCVGTLSAKYLMSQAAVAHAFRLPEEAALQAVTSTPSKALGLDYRVGYVRPGFDADLVVWDAHPLSLGATPLQVFIDGVGQLNQSQVFSSMRSSLEYEIPTRDAAQRPQVRRVQDDQFNDRICEAAMTPGASFVVTGIQRALVDSNPELGNSSDAAGAGPMTLVINKGKISCFGTSESCSKQTHELLEAGQPVQISLQQGHITPGFTALTRGLGMTELEMLKTSGDGVVKGQKLSDPSTIAHAAHGVWLEGKQFARARLGGVTRAISPPISDGLVQGVSVEVLTSGKLGILDGGIVQTDVALHLALDESTQEQQGAISTAVQAIRQMLQHEEVEDADSVFAKVRNGRLPLVVNANNKVYRHVTSLAPF